MYISLDWLRDFVDWSAVEPKDLANRITLHTAEVEEVIDQASKFEHMFVGRITAIAPHPDADKLRLATVDMGAEGTHQLVCGGSNLELDMKVAVAIPGAKVMWHGTDEMVMKKAKIRGEESYGMICAGEEIGLADMQKAQGDDDRAILDLSALDAAPGTPLAQAIGQAGSVIDIDNKSLTHRPDLWGHYGFAREVAAIVDKPLASLDDKLYTGQGGKETEMKVDIRNDELCPRFSACVIKGIKVQDSPQWMKARLIEAGMNPINNIVDITNYVMLELGQPMHAYDRDVVGSNELIVDLGNTDKKLVTLDGDEHDIHAEDPVILNGAGEPLILAGIKGGLKSGISDETSSIILEAANWHPILIRKASTRHALRTDASQRFEKGLDPSMTDIALRHAIRLIKELCPEAEVISPLTTVGTWTAKECEITTSADRINSKIGIQVPKEEMFRILRALQFEVTDHGENFSVKVPLHRMTGDVSIEEDIIEEVARIYGYENVPAILPALPINLPQENTERAHKHDARRIMAHTLGFTELFNYSFYGRELMDKCGVDEAGHIKVLNYLSEDQTHMRKSMTVNMISKIAANANAAEDMKLFEVGRSYEEIGEYMPKEEKKLIAAIATRDEAEVFYRIKGALQSFLRLFRAGKFELKASTEFPPYAHPKKCMDVIVRGQKVGLLFTIHPAVAKNFDLNHQVGFFVLKFSKLIERGRDSANFNEPARFPGMSFDVSVLVDKKTQVRDLQRAILKSDKTKLIQNVELFDSYEGEHIPDGKKSLSFKVDLRHANRTLTDEELHQSQDAVFNALESAGGEIRGR